MCNTLVQSKLFVAGRWVDGMAPLCVVDLVAALAAGGLKPCDAECGRVILDDGRVLSVTAVAWEGKDESDV